ncbi:septum formation initiator [Nonlabens spongiae]|uniref:Septum formation initiator n=1 Tax=Nonlabens spongiae TaxID=331648 RepID=A0A1W6MIT0_9FLAO|nr:septum formation initiator [Nonlabens spongiae]ARN77511.1 septum formation initiator [Nonlabens spongiae]
MKWSELKRKKGFRILTNKYLVILVVFAIWIFFLDGSAWLTSHREIDKQIAEQEEAIRYYREGIARDSAKLKQLRSAEGLETFARERYFMKRTEEEVFIIEFEDSLKQKENE